MATSLLGEEEEVVVVVVVVGLATNLEEKA